MTSTGGNARKDSEIQAAEGAADPELESLIAPQGYSAELVDDVAMMESPAQRRRSALRFLIIMLILGAVLFWLCTPADTVAPKFPAAPFGLHNRPPVPTDKFLENVLPRMVGDFDLVDLRKEQVFEDPFIGATAVQATYVDQAGNPVSVTMIEAESYINARRFLENYKRLLNERTTVVQWQEQLYIEDNFIQWAAPGFADRAYGLAWNNDRYFIAVTSPISASQQALAAEFPY